MATTDYWIYDPSSGDYALVTGAEARDLWYGRGWMDGGEPGEYDKVWVRHEDIGGVTRLNRVAAEGHWYGIGWRFGAPPEPVDTTKDPMLMDAAVLADGPAVTSPQTPSTDTSTKATSGAATPKGK